MWVKDGALTSRNPVLVGSVPQSAIRQRTTLGASVSLRRHYPDRFKGYDLSHSGTPNDGINIRRLPKEQPIELPQIRWSCEPASDSN